MAILVIAANIVFMAFMVIALAMGLPITGTQKPTEPWWGISAVAIGGMMLCLLLIILIGISDRPRFLVVAYLRDKRDPDGGGGLAVTLRSAGNYWAALVDVAVLVGSRRPSRPGYLAVMTAWFDNLW
ncbi:hypothetical protein [Streptomyces cellulosae]|uniref:Uncharacterized protein n=1 Tax=Streptomyces cellulosae TaxID=1968 RepID=A0ABW7XSR2_STRCE